MGADRRFAMSRRTMTGRSSVMFCVDRAAPLAGRGLGLRQSARCLGRRSGPAAPLPQVSEVVVTARRLNEARATIQPQIGASVYTIDAKAIEAMPGGDNTALNQVVLQAPGVAQDSFGQLHVRGEHNGLQYRLDGVILPEGLSVFGQALNPQPRRQGRADHRRPAGAIWPAHRRHRRHHHQERRVQTGGDRSPSTAAATARSSPASNTRAAPASFNYFVSASYLHDDLGVESPDGRSTPLHDVTDQFQGFAYLADIIDPSSRVSLILGASNERFQIPDVTGATPSLMFGPDADQPLVVDGQTTYPSAALNESQKEATYYAVASYLHTTDAFTGQISLFGRYSTLKFVPDPLGDLLFNGIAQNASKSDIAGGVQAEGALHLGEAHTLRAGLIAQIDRSTSNTSSAGDRARSGDRRPDLAISR